MSHPVYNRQNPFLSTILTRHSLTKEGSTKRVDHIELCLKGSGIVYKPGDSVGIFPLNQLTEVEQILKILNASNQEPVTLRDGTIISFRDFLLSRANLQTCSKALFELCLKQHPNSTLQQHITLLDKMHQEHLKTFLNLYHVSDFLTQYNLTQLTPQELTAHLSPMLPRFYSIASSMHAVGETAHLTVGLTTYDIQGQLRHGVTSHYLCHEAKAQTQTIPLYLQSTKDFTIPQDKTKAIIMIGAGTGIAPYRGFIQERLAQGATGANWLIFGDRHRQTDFLYEPLWNSLAKEGKVELSLAFSRDQNDKRYVQHLIIEQGKQLHRWVEDGAILYICGDASKMAKEVEQALLEVFMQHGRTQIEAGKYLQHLRKEKRYLRDIY